MNILGFEIKDGCSGHGCYVRKVKGMGTNGGCNCIPETIPFEDRIRIHKELIKQGYPK